MAKKDHAAIREKMRVGTTGKKTLSRNKKELTSGFWIGKFSS